MSYMRTPKLRIKCETAPEGHKVVFFAWVGDKYYIGHTSSLIFFENELKKQWGKYFRAGVYSNHLFLPILKAASKQERPSIDIRIHFSSESGYDVLKTELSLFEEYFGQKDCLNENNIPYVPKTTHAKSGSNWLTQNEMLNFKKLLKKYEF